ASQLENKDLQLGVSGSEQDQVIRINGKANQIHSKGSGREIRSIVGMEGAKLSLTNEITRTEVLPSPWGPQGVVLRADRGLRISGRLLGNNQVMIEVWVGGGDPGATNSLVSQVCAPIGQWVSLGVVDSGSSGSAGDYGITGNSGNAGWGKKKNANIKTYLVKVELIKN
ncbi:hypothetical protein HYY75_06355, partial [bacterium]|nr:hypothetical protein [bacterium]